jgi:integrase
MAATCATQIGSIIRFACSTAMRLSEIAGMDWLHVDLAQGTVFIEETKNGDSRSVPMFPSARTLVTDLGVRDSGPVWGSKAAIASAWRRAKTAAIAEAERMVREEGGDAGLVTQGRSGAARRRSPAPGGGLKLQPSPRPSGWCGRRAGTRAW